MEDVIVEHLCILLVISVLQLLSILLCGGLRCMCGQASQLVVQLLQLMLELQDSILSII